MKMVKTFIKTQHQHVMPPEEEEKGNALSKLANPITSQSDGQIPLSDTASEHTGGQGERWRERQHSARSTTQPITFIFSVLSLKI